MGTGWGGSRGEGATGWPVWLEGGPPGQGRVRALAGIWPSLQCCGRCLEGFLCFVCVCVCVLFSCTGSQLQHVGYSSPTRDQTPAPALGVSESCSVVSDSLRPHGLYRSWNSLGQNTGVGSLSLLQEIFPTQGLNPGLPHCRWILYQLSHQGRQTLNHWTPRKGPPWKVLTRGGAMGFAF